MRVLERGVAKGHVEAGGFVHTTASAAGKTAGAKRTAFERGLFVANVVVIVVVVIKVNFVSPLIPGSTVLVLRNIFEHRLLLFCF